MKRLEGNTMYFVGNYEKTAIRRPYSTLLCIRPPVSIVLSKGATTLLLLIPCDRYTNLKDEKKT